MNPELNYSYFSISNKYNLSNSNNRLLTSNERMPQYEYYQQSIINIGDDEKIKPRVLCDPIYGSITIPNVCWDIIDKFEFQRLRNLKQLGNSHNVFPGATHNRFEHCIGTAHLANQTMKYLLPELDFLDKEELIYKTNSVVLAGLLHDIGHGPFSHLFDKTLEKLYKQKGFSDSHLENLCEHEFRSVGLIDYMIEKYDSINLEKKQVEFIKDLILGGKETEDSK